MKIFEGVYTALVTPFSGGKIDFESLGKLVNHQMESGVAGFVVNGTTAESPTLSEAEAFELLAFVKQKAQGRVKVIFGSGSNSTEKTIQMSQKAEKAGADGLLVVVPYYNKPPQSGLVKHFQAVARSVSLPVMLYNVPGRTITSLTLESIQEIAKEPNVVAIKEATGNLEFGKSIIDAMGPSFIVSSGDDETALGLKKLGGQGIVSVCSHIIPRQMAKWFHESPVDTALQEFEEYRSLVASLYISPNPVPVKEALYKLGMIATNEVRLPLDVMSGDLIAKLSQQMDPLSTRLL